MQIRHFRRFRQNGPFLARDKNTAYQKHGLCHPGNDYNLDAPARILNDFFSKLGTEITYIFQQLIRIRDRSAKNS